MVKVISNAERPPEPLGQVKESKIKEVEAERVRRTQEMPFRIPSSGTQVNVKINEEPPNKPRQTWLAGASAKGLAAKVKGKSFSNDLIAADDNRYSMDKDDWVTLGEELQTWIKGHLDAASDHAANIEALTTVDDVVGYDVTQNWPS